MKPDRRLLSLSIILFVILFAFVVFPPMTVRGASDCTCNFDPSKMGRSQTLIENKELSSGDRMPTSFDLMFPKTLTVCMFVDPTDKGYPADLKLVFDGSIDGRTWFPLMLAGSRNRAEGTNTCLQVTPVRYVRAGWPAGSNILSPGLRTTIQVQASY